MAFKRVIIRRVGPLSWLLDGLELFSRAFQISRLLFDFYFSSSTRQLTAACAGLASGVSSSAFQHPVVQARPKVLLFPAIRYAALFFSSRGTGTTCIVLSGLASWRAGHQFSPVKLSGYVLTTQSS